MAEPRNAKDALIAEILGDVDKLQKSVDSLKDFLPAQVEAAELRLAGIIAALDKAGNNYQEAVKAFTQQQGDAIRNLMAEEAKNTKLSLQNEHSELLHLSLASMEKAVKTALSSALSDLNTGQVKPNYWQTLVACLASGLLASILVLSATLLANYPDEEKNKELGRAVTTAWPNLDKKARTAIEAQLKK